jgi:hypothetical protein
VGRPTEGSLGLQRLSEQSHYEFVQDYHVLISLGLVPPVVRARKIGDRQSCSTNEAMVWGDSGERVTALIASLRKNRFGATWTSDKAVGVIPFCWIRNYWTGMFISAA